MEVPHIKHSIEKITTDDNISILQSKVEFDNSRCSLDNPILINEEVNYQKEIFSKLKFQYLEQETRDKFLRKISESNGEEVSRQDVDNIAIEAGEKKQQLKRLKIDLSSKIRDLEEITEENIALKKDMDDKKASCDKYIEEIEAMETQLNELIQENTSAKKEVISCVDMEDDMDVENLRNDSVMKLEKEQTRLKRLNNELSLREQMKEDQDQYLQELHEKSIKLDQSLNNIEPFEKPSRSQILAKWCKEMNEILAKFASVDELHISISGETADQVYELTLEAGGVRILLSITREFKIRSCSNDRYSELVQKINSSNSSTIEDFIKKLATFLSNVIRDFTQS